LFFLNFFAFYHLAWGIPKGVLPFGKRNVAVEQKSSDSAISCPTSNIACEEFYAYLKARKIVADPHRSAQLWDNFRYDFGTTSGTILG